ncbi:hypothetical protein [Corallococcus terminator]|uniref:Uncharacterized protein n=1 Tax=Corallococcus terminator TaxID=2316733 RepID=A0A3A8IK25_9BACT|nr:hypothetical protein [Corallococcus terminator]RKG77783.1 hypothetical protein D7V88_30630 [Corallococcus terminator]
MKTYRLRRAALSEAIQLNRRLIFRRLPILLIALGGGLLLGSRGGTALSPVLLGLLCLGALGVMGTSIWRQLRLSETQFARHFDSYVLEAGEGGISHRSEILPETRLGRDEVVHIEESPMLGILLKGQGPGKTMALSPFLEGYAQLKEELTAWRPIAPVSQAQVGRRADAVGLLGVVFGLGISALWMGVGYFSDLRWSMLSGAAMLLCGLGGLTYLRRNCPQIKLKPFVVGLVFFSLSIPARLMLHFLRT